MERKFYIYIYIYTHHDNLSLEYHHRILSIQPRLSLHPTDISRTLNSRREIKNILILS